MPGILIVNDEPLCRDLLQRVLEVEGYDAVGAADGKAGLAAVAAHGPDLVLVDLTMPGMDGWEFLRLLRADPRWRGLPVILVSAAVDLERLALARAMGVRDCLFKAKFTLKDLLARVARYRSPQPPCVGIAASAPGQTAPSSPPQVAHVAAKPGPRPLLDVERCDSRIRRAMGQRAPSPVTAKVIGMAAAPQTDLNELTAVIATDPVLSARVIQVANSAAYASSRKFVATVQDAVRKIGCTAVRNIALALGVMDLAPEGAGFDLIRFWQHSLATARLCESLVTTVEPTDAGAAYVSGLCHDIGNLLFHSLFGEEYRQVADAKAKAGAGAKAEDLERVTFGVTRAELVQRIHRSIRLPDSVMKPIEAMYATTAPAGQLVAALRMSDAYANGLLLATHASSEVTAFTRAQWKGAGPGEEPPAPDADGFRSEVVALTASLARLSGKEQSQATEPLFPRGDVRLWLARDAAMSNFDPIGVALSSMADVAVHPRLPTATELDGRSGLVVVCRADGTAGFSRQEVERLVAGRAVAALHWSARSERPAAAGAVLCASSFMPLAELARFCEICRQRCSAGGGDVLAA